MWVSVGESGKVIEGRTASRDGPGASGGPEQQVQSVRRPCTPTAARHAALTVLLQDVVQGRLGRSGVWWYQPAVEGWWRRVPCAAARQQQQQQQQTASAACRPNEVHVLC